MRVEEIRIEIQTVVAGDYRKRMTTLQNRIINHCVTAVRGALPPNLGPAVIDVPAHSHSFEMASLPFISQCHPSTFPHTDDLTVRQCVPVKGLGIEVVIIIGRKGTRFAGVIALLFIPLLNHQVVGKQFVDGLYESGVRRFLIERKMRRVVLVESLVFVESHPIDRAVFAGTVNFSYSSSDTVTVIG